MLRHYGYFVPSGRREYRIPCPIHKGHDSNFSVSERAGLWNCFSVCGRGGSVIDLVAELEKISVVDAAEKLSREFHLGRVTNSIVAAHQFNDQVERYKKMKADNKVELPSHRILETGYRSLTRETIEHWSLARTDTGVMIPLVSNGGKPCSYSIRRDDGKPKYENAPGASKCWPFGLWQNMQDIIDAGFAYVVEGQMDAITMWQYGYRNVVAIMGSQISEQQALLLLGVIPTLILVMDGDEPGRKAAKEIKSKWGSVFTIGQIAMPDGIDPDEYLLKGGKLDVMGTVRTGSNDIQ